jgi:predicted PurR-regulated permease PerM
MSDAKAIPAYEVNTQRNMNKQRALVALGVVAIIVLALATLSYVIEVALLVFAGVILAVLLHAMAAAVCRITHVGNGRALAAVVVSIVTIVSVIIWLFASSIAEQVDQLSITVPDAIARGRERLNEYQWGRYISSRLTADTIGQQPGVITRVTGFLTNTVSSLANVLIVVAIGLYLAAEPEMYLNGLLHLIPIARRPRAREVLERLGDVLKWWVLARLCSMLIVGTLAGAGLWALGTELAPLLGILAALAELIPNIGPILAFGPPLLIALGQSPQLALYVFLLFLGIQLLESYVITPLVERRIVDTPPAVLITVQVLFAVLFGALGLLVAAPMAAVAMNVVKMLYVEDRLGEDPKADPMQPVPSLT